MRSRRPAVAAFLIVVGCAAVVLTWAMTPPPFAGLDEAAHFTRAAGVAEGQLAGDPAVNKNEGLTPKQSEMVNQTTRAVTVPANLAAFPNECPPTGPPRCRAITYVGGYQPLPYLLPALVLDARDTGGAADRQARAMTGLLCLGLLALAGALLWDPTRGLISLVGLSVATTPMVLYLSGTLNGSGPEICAAIATLAGLLRLGREAASKPWVWAAVAAAGAMTALSRATGPLWLALFVLLAIAVSGAPTWRKKVTEAPRAAGLAAAAWVAAVIGNRLWEASYGATPSLGITPLSDSARTVREQILATLESSVANFGALVVPVRLAQIGWALLVLALVFLAVRKGTRRDRAVLGAAIVVALLTVAALLASVGRNTGFGIQGRHVLPILVAIPLVAGHQLTKRARDRSAGLAIGIVGASLALQWVSFYAFAKFFASGTGTLWIFRSHPGFPPPGGWDLWLVIAAAGIVAMWFGALQLARIEAPVRTYAEARL